MYICHYEGPPDSPRLSCRDLISAFVRRYSRAPDLSANPRIGFPSDTGASDAEHPVDDGLHIIEAWAAVARLQWALASDRYISGENAAALITRLQANGELNTIRRAARLLVTTLAAAYPSLACVDRSLLIQIIALGADMAKAVGSSPELFQFVEKELQPVDLATLLRI